MEQLLGGTDSLHGLDREGGSSEKRRQACVAGGERYSLVSADRPGDGLECWIELPVPAVEEEGGHFFDLRFLDQPLRNEPSDRQPQTRPGAGGDHRPAGEAVSAGGAGGNGGSRDREPGGRGKLG